MKDDTLLIAGALIVAYLLWQDAEKKKAAQAALKSAQQTQDVLTTALTYGAKVVTSAGSWIYDEFHSGDDVVWVES